MDRDLTFNSIDFDFAFDSESRSERRSNARGINTPDILSIQRQSATVRGLPTTRSSIRVERTAVDSVTGQPYTVAFYVVMEVPSNAVSGDITAITATFKAAVANADLIADVLNGEL